MLDKIVLSQEYLTSEGLVEAAEMLLVVDFNIEDWLLGW